MWRGGARALCRKRINGRAVLHRTRSRTVMSGCVVSPSDAAYMYAADPYAAYMNAPISGENARPTMPRVDMRVDHIIYVECI